MSEAFPIQSFYKNSSAALVVFDSCNPSTLNRVTEWKEIIDFMVRQKNGDPIPVFLLANKVHIVYSYSLHKPFIVCTVYIWG